MPKLLFLPEPAGHTQRTDDGHEHTEQATGQVRGHTPPLTAQTTMKPVNAAGLTHVNRPRVARRPRLRDGRGPRPASDRGSLVEGKEALSRKGVSTGLLPYDVVWRARSGPGSA